MEIVYWFGFIPIPVTWSFTNDTGKCSPDACPGGNYNTFDQVESALKKFGATIEINESSHCFMPFTSVLDISGDMNFCTDVSNRDLVAEGLTPFQSYAGSDTNMYHVTFNGTLVDYLIKEFETYITPGNRTIDLCDDPVQYSVHFPAGKSSNVTWTCSSNLQIVSGNGTSIIKVKALGVGEGWIEATLTGNNILTHNKTLKKYSIEVKYKGTSPTNASETITSSVTWNAPYLVSSNLTISNNATLTLKNTNIYIAEGCKITVNSGSKLIIDGAILTNSCDDLWQGIIVMSDPTKPMNTTNQGYVEVKNNGKIENAVCAIEVKGGGIVKTNYANFSNNKTGINFLPLSSGQNSTSISLLNTNFSYTELTGFDQHIKMNGCGNVILNHCKLTGNNNKGVEIKNVSVVNWGVNILEDATVSIQAGGTLTLTDTMYFAGDATINVQQYGGKLIVNGGILDKYYTEEYQWKGITVMGVSNQPINQNYQGYAEFKNGAKILNAVTGITVQGGGIINVNNTQFINNKTGVKFEAINPIYSGTSGTFANTTFEINNNYLGNLTDFSSHLNMQKCATVNVSGCSFSLPLSLANRSSIIVSNAPTNWTNSNYLNRSNSIVLQGGAKLTNTGTIYCGNNVDITIWPEGKLIVDGGKLTNISLFVGVLDTSYSNKGEMWQGITISEGISSSIYQPIITPGLVKIINGGTIENAVCGIKSLYGGIVDANNATFLNNKTGVWFKPLRPDQINISSTFSNTIFKIDDNFISDLQSEHDERGINSHLIMDSCGMVSVSDCAFSNTSSNILSDGIIVENTITNWSNNNTILSVPLTLLSGATLINTGNINCNMNTNIEVYPESKLIIDGGKLSSTLQRPGMWQGVTVYGGLVPTDTAMIELTNGGTIENALCGITVNDYGTVTANNAHFLNNTVGVKFNPVQNNSMFTSGTFKNTNFELNNDYTGDDPFDTHIIMENTGSVNINQSTFSSTVIKKDTKANKGIVAQNSNLIIGDICKGNEKCITFSGFNAAIYAINRESTRFFKVLNSVFENNLSGVEILGINNIEIRNNEFSVSEDGAVGVSLTGSTGYKIERNDFSRVINSGIVPSITTFGLRISDSGTEPNEVSLNTFDGLSIGQMFSGINGDRITGMGLQSLCNTFTGRTGRIHDIYIGRYPNNNPNETHFIATDQGNADVPAGNKFYKADSIINISNNSYPNTNINYYYGPGNLEFPTYNNLTPISVEKEALCESRNDEVGGMGYEVSGDDEVSGMRYEVSGENQSKSVSSALSVCKENDITLIPNPTTGKLQVTSYELQVTGVEVFDIYGRNLTPHTTYLAPHTSLDITDLASGVYFVKIYTNAGVVVKKVVKS